MKPGTRVKVLPNENAVPEGLGTVVDINDYPDCRDWPHSPAAIGLISDKVQVAADSCFFARARFLEVLT
jgi:hypothetical protein